MKPRPSDNTVTIVTRVPAPLAATFESRCRAAGTTPSTALRSLVEATVTTRPATPSTVPATRSAEPAKPALSPTELAAAKQMGIDQDPAKLEAFAALRAERRQYAAAREADRAEQQRAIAAQDRYRRSLPKD